MEDPPKKERNFPNLQLPDPTTSTTLNQQQPILEIQSPKTPTLSRKLKAVSLDSDPTHTKPQTNLEISRDVFSMPNTPKRQIKHKLSCDFDDDDIIIDNNNDVDVDDDDDDIDTIDDDDDDDDDDYDEINHIITQSSQKIPTTASSTSSATTTNNLTKLTTTLAPNSNLKKFASNSSISGSQTLKTLPEIMTLQDFSDNKTEPIRIKTKGLLERRGSNASLTIDLGSNSNITEPKNFLKLNQAKSVSNLNLTSFGGNNGSSGGGIMERCSCAIEKKLIQERRKSQEACGNCTIYEFEPCWQNKLEMCQQRRCGSFTSIRRNNQSSSSSTSGGGNSTTCNSCTCVKYRRKSLSNENLYVPARGGGCCQATAGNFNSSRQCKNYRRAHYPRQPDLEAMTLSEDFKMHLQNVQYLQTAGSVLSVQDLKLSCEMARVPKLHSEFWEVPLNLQEKSYVPGSHNRNRYKGVLPNEHSRVHLPGPQSYIHANYIRGPDYTETAYIATQGPMAHTCQDFWDMVWHSNCICIVMLTGLVEKGRSKCELYFPLGRKDYSSAKSFFYVKTTKERDKFTFDSRNIQYDEEIIEFEEFDELEYGEYKIKYLDEEYVDECIIRRLELIKKTTTNEQSRIIRHYWYPNWQDHKISNPEQLLKMALHLLDTIEASGANFKRKKSIDSKNTSSTTTPQLPPQPLSKVVVGIERKKSLDQAVLVKDIPIIVHCSAGIGRTGCFLAILNGIQQLKTNFNVDVLAILCSLRLNRGGMVQTAEQYELIHRVLNLYADTM